MLVAFDLTSEHPPTVKSTIFEDNNGALATACTPKMSRHTKYIAVKYHFVKSLFGKTSSVESVSALAKIDTLFQKADILCGKTAANLYEYVM